MLNVWDIYIYIYMKKSQLGGAGDDACGHGLPKRWLGVNETS